MNELIEQIFDNDGGYYLIKMQDSSNATTTTDGEVFVVGFNKPRMCWDKELNDMTIGEYKELENMYMDANICLTSPMYSPFQLGQRVSSVDRARPIAGVDIWDFIDKCKGSDIKDYYRFSEILSSMNKKEVVV